MITLKDIEAKIEKHAADLANNNAYFKQIMDEIQRLTTMKDNIVAVLHQQNGAAQILADLKKTIVDGFTGVTTVAADVAAGNVIGAVTAGISAGTTVVSDVQTDVTDIKPVVQAVEAAVKS